MADDDRLLERLSRALAAPAAEPSPEGVARVRQLAQGTAPLSGRPARRRSRGWQAGIAGVAAALVLAPLALPGLMRSGNGGGDTQTVARETTAAVNRLRVALLSEDPVAVARADADLLRKSRNLGRSELETAATAAHIAAVQFLRDHPSPDVLAEVAPSETAPPGDPATGEPTADPSADPAPDGAADVAGATESVETTVVAGARSVTILGIVPLLDATFQVAYSVSGFTPDASGLPGTHSVRFTFDDGQSPTTWGGPSPWSFPVVAGLAHQRLCAHVADAAGVVDPASGGCRDIL